MKSILSLTVITLSILPALIYRIKIEEKILMNEFGGTDKTIWKKRIR